ncbi:MAG: hypothetical protein ACLUEQ_08780 [Cloacibacillus evryensis]
MVLQGALLPIISCPCALVSRSRSASSAHRRRGAQRHPREGSSYLDAMSRLARSHDRPARRPRRLQGHGTAARGGRLQRGCSTRRERGAVKSSDRETIRRPSAAKRRSGPTRASSQAGHRSARQGTLYAGNTKPAKDIGIGLKNTLRPPCIALNGKYLGALLIADELKPGVRAAMNDLRAAGYAPRDADRRQRGDREGDGRRSRHRHVRAELLPQDKTAELEKLMAGEEKKTARRRRDQRRAGLTRADIGIAMGGIGSGRRDEAADVVIPTDEVDKIATAVRIAVKTKRIVWENIAMALGFKVAVMLLAIFATPPSVAIFADVGWRFAG